MIRYESKDGDRFVLRSPKVVETHRGLVLRASYAMEDRPLEPLGLGDFPIEGSRVIERLPSDLAEAA